MKILALGDFHCEFPRHLKKIAKECDLILCTGDFSGSKKARNLLFRMITRAPHKKDFTQLERYEKEEHRKGRKIIEELAKLKVPVLTVTGNHDFEVKGSDRSETYPHLIKRLTGIREVRKRITKEQGLLIYGFGTNVVPTIFTTKRLNRNESKRKKALQEHQKLADQLLKKGKKNIDILLAHYPPKGIFDEIVHEHNPLQGEHVGFAPYTTFIRKFSPKLFICGHMHEHQGAIKVGKTLVVATGAAVDGKAALIEWEEGKEPKITLVKKGSNYLYK